MKNKLKNILKNVKINAIEYYTLALLIIGLPFIAFIYSDWRLAISTFIAVNLTIGLLLVYVDSKGDE